MVGTLTYRRLLSDEVIPISCDSTPTRPSALPIQCPTMTGSNIIVVLGWWRLNNLQDSIRIKNKNNSSTTLVFITNLEWNGDSSLCCISTCPVFLQLLSSISIIRLFRKTVCGLAHVGSSELPINSSHKAGRHASVLPGVHSDSLTRGSIRCMLTHERRGEADFSRVSEPGFVFHPFCSEQDHARKER